jgi:hypothetical protein
LKQKIILVLLAIVLAACANKKDGILSAKTHAPKVVWADVRSDISEAITGTLTCSQASLSIGFCRNDALLSPAKSEAALSDFCRGQPLLDMAQITNQTERVALAQWIDSIVSEPSFTGLAYPNKSMTKARFKELHDADQRLRLLDVSGQSIAPETVYAAKWIANCAYSRYVATLIKPHLTPQFITALNDDEALATHVWVLVQHSDFDPAWQASVAQQFETSPIISMRKNAAFLIDRALVARGQPQKYGTQLRCSNGRREPFPVAQAVGVDDRRGSVGMEPLQERISSFPRPCPK